MKVSDNMTESEAIKICNTIIFASSLNNPQGTALNTTKEELAEAMCMAIQALEKQIPKKPTFDHNISDTLSVFHCECGNTIKVSHDAGIMNNNNATNYCSKCGCKLDWSDKESEETKL